MEVVVRGDSLFAYTTGISYYLEHYHYDVFRALPLDEGRREDLSSFPIRLAFATSLQGDVDAVHVYGIEPAVEKISFRRQLQDAEVPLSVLERYCGMYQLGPTEIRIFLKGKTLTISVPGQPEYETAPIDEQTFRLKALEGYRIRFDLREDRTPQAVLFIQPNGTFRAKRKDP